MNRLLRYWNQNRRKILITIAVIVFFLIVIQVANEIVKNNNKVSQNNNAIISISKDVTNPEKVVSTDDKIKKDKAEFNSKIIKDFINLCNEQNVILAFDMISKDCKEELYNNNVDIFKKEYIDKIFSNSKTYEAELWYSNNDKFTYKIVYNDGNPLETGNLINKNNFLDYITIVKENDKWKLNINKFIDKKSLNKTKIENDITVKINSKKIYLDYEEYNISILNNSNHNIGISNNAKIYIEDRAGNKYSSRVYEVPNYSLNVNKQRKSTFDLKFNKPYKGQSDIEYIVIENINMVLEDDNAEDKMDCVSFKIKV